MWKSPHAVKRQVKMLHNVQNLCQFIPILTYWFISDIKSMPQHYSLLLATLIYQKIESENGCTKCPNLEIEGKYLKKTDIQLNPNILRRKNDAYIL